jgi:hypothetical protein
MGTLRGDLTHRHVILTVQHNVFHTYLTSVAQGKSRVGCGVTVSILVAQLRITSKIRHSR